MKLTIIGAGPGGYETAVAAARKGVEVTLISDGPVGGTCLNEGCIPTKAFCRNAELMDSLAKAETFGLDGLEYKFDFSRVKARKDAVVKQLRSGVEFLLRDGRVTLVHGRGRLKDAHTVVADGKEYVSDAIFLATGSYSASLPIPGQEWAVTSREMLDVERLPERLCIIGAGVIGLEFASIFRSFGSEVTVLEYCRNVLPHFDAELAKRLKQALARRGIVIETEAQVQRIDRTERGLRVGYVKKGKEAATEADKVLMAVGRRPNVEGLGLAEAGIDYSPNGIVTDRDMRTNVPSVFAIGDVTGGLMLAHTAVFQGRKALSALLEEDGAEAGINLSIVPAAVFTRPEAAVVGMTEDECRERGVAVKCLKSFFRANGKAVSMDESEGFCKLVTADGTERQGLGGGKDETGTVEDGTRRQGFGDGKTESGTDKDGMGRQDFGTFRTGEILGCHIIGPHAADLVQEVAALMHFRATVGEFRAVIHAHPTLGEVLQDALRA